MYRGVAPDSSGRTRDHAPSAPISTARKDGGAVGEAQLVAALAEGLHAADLAPPVHDAVRKRVQQQLPQLAARNLGTLARAVVGPVEQNSPGPVQNPVGLAAGQDEAPELPGQAGRLER